MIDKEVQRQLEQRSVTITEVNLANHRIIAKDKNSTTIYLTMNFHQPILVIPSVGEVWLAKRKGFDWYLERRGDNGDEKTPITSMMAGDTRIESDGSLYINTPQIVINGTVWVPQGLITLVSGTQFVGTVLSIDVTHGCSFTPLAQEISLTPQGDPGTRFWISAVSSSTFTISYSSTATPHTMGWKIDHNGG